MPLQATSGAASYDAFGGGAPVVYIEQIFSTFLYTGNGSTQTITNGIDLAGKGGMVWVKDRSVARTAAIADTVRGITNVVYPSETLTQQPANQIFSSVSSTGFTVGVDFQANASSETYVTWTFREQPKFFDVVTYTGNGVAGRSVAHNLGSVPGCVIVKRIDSSGAWQVYHQSLANTEYLVLNTTAAKATGATRWNSTTPTSTVFSLGTDATVNANGGTYVAYIFAHDAGGFGLTGTDNVISCGSFTAATTNSVDIGYEPQWLLVKDATSANDWYLVDAMRGLSLTGGSLLNPNTSLAETALASGKLYPTATGFIHNSLFPAGDNIIYIAIRRGPMKTPTSGTSVFAPVAQAGGGTVTTNFPIDLIVSTVRTGDDREFRDRLRGGTTTSGLRLRSNSTGAEISNTSGLSFQSNTGSTDAWYNSAQSIVYECFRRAPNFFDEICFSGSGANKTEAHNLGVPPELWLVKSRSNATEWVFGSSLLAANEKIVMPSPNGRVTDATVWNSTYPTASVLSLGTSSTTNASGQTFVGYLWATVAGVSKVGTYTGNGSSQTIDCGFTGGARFVMIIRATASTAQDIYIWDSARGIVAGNDPRLSLNTTAAEVTSLDTIDTAASGFVINTDASNVNVNGSVYLYLSIA